MNILKNIIYSFLESNGTTYKTILYEGNDMIENDQWQNRQEKY